MLDKSTKISYFICKQIGEIKMKMKKNSIVVLSMTEDYDKGNKKDIEKTKKEFQELGYHTVILPYGVVSEFIMDSDITKWSDKTEGDE